tara:strand:+ start:64 stop:531 length:468 start_codon:yes stop_codon:yes gene_type:complete
MKKKILSNPFFIGLVSIFLAYVISGPRFGIYDYLPKYYLFQLPNDTLSGNVVYTFFKWNLACLIMILYLTIIYFNKKNELDFFKYLKKAFELDGKLFFILALIFSTVMPSIFLLLDFINLSINWVNPKNDNIFPVTHAILFFVWIISIFYGSLKK